MICKIFDFENVFIVLIIISIFVCSLLLLSITKYKYNISIYGSRKHGFGYTISDMGITKFMIQMPGIIVFWLSWPVLYLYLKNSTRSRVLITYQDEILVSKTWIGSGSWTLPGGGVHKDEEPVDAAAREIQEELGLAISPQSYELLDRMKHRSHGLEYEAVFFALELPSKPPIKQQRIEMSDACWIRRTKINEHDIGSDVITALQLLSHKGKNKGLALDSGKAV